MELRTKALLSAAAMGALLLAVRPLTAGEYHSGAMLVCADCHTMHASQQHNYTGGGSPSTDTPRPKLLRQDSAQLCLTCHDGASTIPDVLGENTGTHIREAGGLSGSGDNDRTSEGYPAYTGHTLGASTSAPGGTWAPGGNGLSCVHCHEPHGVAEADTRDVAGNTVTSTYRNLRSNPGPGTKLGVSYAKGTNVATRDVFLRGWTEGDTAANYQASNIDLNEPVTTQSGIGRWCQGCHTDFHGKQGDAAMGGTGGVNWSRHPTADANVGASSADGTHSSLATFRGRLYRTKVMSGGTTPDWGTQGTAWTTAPTTLTPTCLSCHKAHGNKNPFGLVYLTGATAPTTEEGDGTGVKDLCQQCHVQGSEAI